MLSDLKGDVVREIFLKGSENQICYGDCLEVMDTWLENFADGVDLVYIDPPESRGFSFKLIQKIGINQGKTTHSEKMPKNMSKSEYLELIKSVIIKSKALLKDTGNIFIHCPSKTSHHIRGILDEVFGSSNFANEIIFKHNHTSNSQHHFTYSHDTILFYSKSPQGYFDPEPTAHTRGKDRRNHMKKDISKDGRVFYSMNVSGKEYRYYEDDLIHMEDIWDDIEDSLENSRIHWDGCKPYELIKRIVLSACPENGIVCDPFCGSGTAGLVCADLNRSFLMCDNSPFAINISKYAIAQKKVPFFVDWGKASILSDAPEVKFSTEGLKIHLDDYRAEGGQEYYSNNLLPTEDTLVEFWSVGQMKYNKYHVDDFDARTDSKPALGRSLKLSRLNGEPYALVCDAFGNMSIHALKMD